MKNFWLTSLVFTFSVLFPALSFAQLVCRGELSLSSGDKATVGLSQPTLREGGTMGLWHPITDDIDAGVQLTIQRLIKTPEGLRVFATYDRTNLTAFVTFEAKQLPGGETMLSDFKGFEGAISFGPSEIKCAEE